MDPRVARYSDLVTLGLALLPEYSTGHIRKGGLPRCRKSALVTSACASPRELLCSGDDKRNMSTYAIKLE